MDSDRENSVENEQEEELPEPEVSQRKGGPQGDDDDSDAKKKAEERERKKAEVRARLQEAGKAKKAKKGFLTPERKKKLRKLLMQKAAEDLKQQQLLKEQERQRILKERIVPLPAVESISAQAELEKIIHDFQARIVSISDGKYDLDYEVRQKDFEINELTIAVNDLRGKFVKPTLKKVSKYDNKFKKLQAQSEDKKVDFRGNLKIVKKDAFDINDLLKPKGETEWGKKEEGAEPEPEAAPAE